MSSLFVPALPALGGLHLNTLVTTDTTIIITATCAASSSAARSALPRLLRRQPALSDKVDMGDAARRVRRPPHCTAGHGCIAGCGDELSPMISRAHAGIVLVPSDG